jgi:Holliday junction resolvase RusA-like endonuclease
MGQTIKFFVAGLPAPRGSKNSYVPLNRKTNQPYRRANGGVMVQTVDTNPKSKPWMSTISHAASTLFDVPLSGAIGLRLTFTMPRPKSHFRSVSKRPVLRDDAPKYHTSKPDRGKLARAVEDALTAIAYVDDSQVCCGPIEKVYGDRPGVEIELTAMQSPGGSER